MDCKEIQAELSAYIDQELAPAVQEGIRLHLAVCGQCNARYAELLRGWQALEAWEDVMPPERLRKKILDSVRPQRRPIPLRTVLSVAAVLFIVFGIVLYYAAQKGRTLQDHAASRASLQAAAVNDISEDEIIANLLILEENDFFEALDDLVMIDELPLVEEPSNNIKGPDRSSLELTFS